MRRIAIGAVLLILGTGLLWAQSDRATITGEVHDAAGAVIPGAKVAVINTGTNDVRNVVSSASGIYTVPNLPIGAYKLVFVKDGFKALTRDGITLSIGQTVNISVELSVGAKTETVEVSGEASVLQTEDSKVTTNINSRAVVDLPLNVSGGRSLSAFMFNYVPGVEGSDYASHINGSVALSKEVLIDGTSAVSQLGGYISESQPPMEGVQEFQVSTAGISADEGRSGGGVFRYEMKSGSNRWHGGAFGFLHENSLDALSSNAKLDAINDPALRNVYLRKVDSLSDWGGSIGGPVKKDKLFFYAAFERYMASDWNLGAPYSTVPTDTMMGLTSTGATAAYADLSAQLDKSTVLGTDSAGNTIYKGAIFDPSTGDVFVNNLIPSARISTTSAKILQLYHKYYQPETATAQNNAMPDTTLPWNHITESSIKLDYNLSDRHRMNGSFIYNYYPRILADQGGIWSATSADGGPLANSYNHDTKAPAVRLSDTYSFTNNVMNSLRFTMNRFYNPSLATSQSGKWDQYLGLGDGAGNFPLISFHSSMYNAGGAVPSNGYYLSSIGSQFNDFYAANTFIFNDDVTWTRGRHTLKFGGEFRAMQFNNHPDVGTFNSIAFDPVTTGNAAYWQQTGSAFASFLLGDVFSGSTRNETDPLYGRRKSASLFAEDSIKLTSKLTVDMALRWDYNNRYKEKYGHWSNFDINAVNSVTGLQGAYEYLTSGNQSFEKRQYWANFAPHLGAAYAVNSKTVLRSSLSLFYVPLNANTWGGIPYQQTGNPGYHAVDATSGVTNWDGGWQGTSTEYQSPAYTQWSAVYIDHRALELGNTMQFMVGAQRELARDLKLDVSYIQNRDHHLHSGTLETNQPTIQTYRNFLSTGKFPSSYNGYFGYGASGPWYAGLLPYPQAAYGYGPLFSVDAPLGNSSYNGLQFSLTKRTTHGLNLQGSYVYSRARGDVDTSMSELWGVGSIQNIYDLQSERKDIASFDMTHVVKGYIQYELPFGHGKKLLGNSSTLVDKMVGGWTMNGGFHYNTGTPMQIHSTNSYPGFAAIYVNLVSGCQLTNGSPHLGKRYLNPNCFKDPDAASGQLGTAGNYIEQLRNPGMATEDVSLIKSVAFGGGDRYRVSLRFDFFNVFNRHMPGSPVTDRTQSNFGTVTSYGGQGGRIGQFGARFSF